MALPADVGAGKAVTLNTDVVAPTTPGAYTLRWDLVEEGGAWFAERGATPLEIPVRVQQTGTPPAKWIASASHNTVDAAKAIDGDAASAWSSAKTQEPGMWFKIDLGAEQQVSGLSMVSPDKDFPRGYVIEVSTDGNVWSEAARKDPNWKSVEAVFVAMPARYVRITQTRTPRWPVNWTISDVSIATASLWTATASPNAGTPRWPSTATRRRCGRPRAAAPGGVVPA